MSLKTQRLITPVATNTWIDAKLAKFQSLADDTKFALIGLTKEIYARQYTLIVRPRGHHAVAKWPIRWILGGQQDGFSRDQLGGFLE